ncbi:MAG: Na(+)-translocating NADH-quinone reductase subunit A [Prevotellaceae bacterium]|nr:Na(+)-translocating NADH-quinone reductase subunit A [Prevotellaceae bacterium]
MIIKRFKLKKGLDINLQGRAALNTTEVAAVGTFAVMPDDFNGFKPKPVVKEGDIVKAGDALLVNKEQPELKVVSPVSGKVSAIVRGERRKLLSVNVEADAEQQYKQFSVSNVASMSGEELKALLLESGLFAFIKQRPFDIVANPEDTPKGIFVSLFSKMPLAQDFSYIVKGNEKYVSAALDALSKIAPVSVSICKEQEGQLDIAIEKASMYVFDGPNPSGNVGVQINHIAPVNKGEVVWTVGGEELIFIGKLLLEGKVDLTRCVAVAGSEIAEPHYVRTLIGASLANVLKGNLKSQEHVRIINGNPLVGTRAGLDAYLSARATEVTAIPEGDDKDEVLGWIMPRFNDYSTSRSYFTWLQGKRKEYNLDARIKGGERHIIMSGEYDRYLPMDIYGGFLIKAILTGDLDRMEALGIYEVAPEDFAVAEFADSSKLELQRIVREGIELLRKEL